MWALLRVGSIHLRVCVWEGSITKSFLNVDKTVKWKDKATYSSEELNMKTWLPSKEPVQVLTMSALAVNKATANLQSGMLQDSDGVLIVKYFLRPMWALCAVRRNIRRSVHRWIIHLRLQYH